MFKKPHIIGGIIALNVIVALFIISDTSPTSFLSKTKLVPLQDEYGDNFEDQNYYNPGFEDPPPPPPHGPPPPPPPHGPPPPFPNDHQYVAPDPVTVTVTETATATATATHAPPPPLAYCDDPYKRPGHLAIAPVTDELRSQWIPFYEDDMFRDSVASIEEELPEFEDLTFYPDNSTAVFPQDMLSHAPISWTAKVAEYVKLVNKRDSSKDDEGSSSLTEQEMSRMDELSKELNWLRSRRVLFLADSVDRFMLLWFCEEVGHHEYFSQGVVHTTAQCHIPELNFTLFHWHIASMLRTKPDWWWQPIMEYVPFEVRYEKLFEPTLANVTGLNGHGPDLILYQSLLWDAMAFAHARNASFGSPNPYRLPTWRELEYYRDRQRKFISFFRNLFGADTPMMYRTETPKKKESHENLFLHGLDRMSRFIANNEGIEVFEASHIMLGFPQYFRDNQHIVRSPLSYIYGDMVLYYLFRAAGGAEFRGEVVVWPSQRTGLTQSQKWAECHESNMIMMNR
ncbi:uncharacterized protein V1516DRAFT_676840 [Lipomyces oligophaga]|uniref:uncharacterized protein n=1 Tax=Lipomyces oligophaga TaxID=45792 RepID=UPI0034CD83CA